jgi:hypothetical protein
MRFIVISLLVVLLPTGLLAWFFGNNDWIYLGLFIFVCIVAAGSKRIQKIAGTLAMISFLSILTFAYLEHKRILFLTHQQTELIVGSLVVLFVALMINLIRKLNRESSVVVQQTTASPQNTQIQTEQAPTQQKVTVTSEEIALIGALTSAHETEEKILGPTLMETISDITPEHFFTEKVDWQRVNKDNKQIGDTGERIVVNYEQNLLREAGLPELVERVEHTAKIQGDGVGYDVLSFYPDGREKYIEVKSTQKMMHSSFFITHNELDFLRKHQEQAFIYCITEATSNEPKLAIYTAEQFLQFAQLTPAEYKFFV